MKAWVKNILIFIGGMATTVLALVILTSFEKPDTGITWLDKKGDCITKNSIEVFQVLEPSVALATTKSDFGYSGKVVLVINKEGKIYYDEEIVNVPAKKCMRQVGTYKYRAKNEMMKTVPIVNID